MYYTSFNVQHFRGIETVTLDLSHNRILTLVGLNESGKSTILTAINIFYRMIKGNDPQEAEINGFRPKGIDFTGSIEITGDLHFEEDDIKKLTEYCNANNITMALRFPDVFSYTYHFNYNLHKYIDTVKRCQFEIYDTTSGKKLQDIDPSIWSALIAYVRQHLVPEILFYEDFIFDIPEKVLFSKDGAMIPDPTTKNTEWQYVLNDILKAVNPDFPSFHESVVSIWDTDNDTASNRISSMEGVLNKKITSGWKDLFKKPTKRNSVQRLNFKEIKLVAIQDGTNLNISFKVKTDSEKEFLINERSKGCKWFFSFLLFTEFRKNRTKNILFLLDEPASNLHSSAQMKIMDAIDELSDGSIVIYSTHSHHLINPKWLSGAYVIINEIISDKQLAGDMTFDECAKISAEKYFSYIGKGYGLVKTSYFQPILDRLDYKPSNVEPIPDINITEGKNDWYTFKYFSEVVVKDSYAYHFYPGAGATQLWDIIRLYLSWGKQFNVILDGDDSGVDAKQKYINEFGKFVDYRIFTLRDIFSQKWETENLIAHNDQELICDTVFGAGKYKGISSNPQQLKLTLYTAINQLLIDGKALSYSQATVTNFKTLFKYIRSQKHVGIQRPLSRKSVL